MQLAGQISENNIQEFLVGSQYPKSENLVRNPEIFLTFFVGRIKPRFEELYYDQVAMGSGYHKFF